MIYDAIVVGARCGGASTAVQLARLGHKVLMLDRSTFPSDMTASTHMLWGGGVAELNKLGLLDKIKASNCPAMPTYNLDMGDFVLSAHATPNDGVTDSYAPRRVVLDGILVEAAVNAGVEMIEDCSVEELLHDGDTVVGVRYRNTKGESIDVHSRLLIGADGTNSTIAKLVNAPSYDEHPKYHGTFFAYFSDLHLNDMEFYSRPSRMFYAWSTNDGLTVVGLGSPYATYKSFQQDFDTAFYSELKALAPAFHDRVRAAKRETQWMGGATRNFKRQPWGAGWALVGDAGLTMDPISACGISNALRDARFLAEAAHDGLSEAVPMDKALAGYENRRNDAGDALFDFTYDMAKLEPPTPEATELFTALQYSPEDISAYFGIFAGSVSAADFFDPKNTQRIIDNAPL